MKCLPDQIGSGNSMRQLADFADIAVSTEFYQHCVTELTDEAREAVNAGRDETDLIAFVCAGAEGYWTQLFTTPEFREHFADNPCFLGILATQPGGSKGWLRVWLHDTCRSFSFQRFAKLADPACVVVDPFGEVSP